jgi:hypothetical protein
VPKEGGDFWFAAFAYDENSSGRGRRRLFTTQLQKKCKRSDEEGKK